MRHYISNSLTEQKYINKMVLENHELIKENSKNIQKLQEVFDKFEEKRKDNEIYFNGQILMLITKYMRYVIPLRKI